MNVSQANMILKSGSGNAQAVAEAREVLTAAGLPIPEAKPVSANKQKFLDNIQNADAHRQMLADYESGRFVPSSEAEWKALRDAADNPNLHAERGGAYKSSKAIDQASLSATEKAEADWRAQVEAQPWYQEFTDGGRYTGRGQAQNIWKWKVGEGFYNLGNQLIDKYGTSDPFEYAMKQGLRPAEGFGGRWQPSKGSQTRNENVPDKARFERQRQDAARAQQSLWQSLRKRGFTNQELRDYEASGKSLSDLNAPGSLENLRAPQQQQQSGLVSQAMPTSPPPAPKGPEFLVMGHGKKVDAQSMQPLVGSAIGQKWNETR